MKAAGQDTVVNSEEERLVREAWRGNLKAFSALVEASQEKMIHTAFSFLGNMEDAEDVAQEAFVKAYRSLPSFNERSRFSTWLYRILVNHCKDFLRQKKVRQHLNTFWGRKTDEEVDPVLELAASTPSPRQELVDRELGKEIHSALDKLPLQQKSVFTLRYLEGLKLEEISGILNLSTGAVKAHLWQAAQKMKIILKPHFPGGGD